MTPTQDAAMTKSDEIAPQSALREALESFAKIDLWRDFYPDSIDKIADTRLRDYFTPEQVRAARAALATAPAPAEDVRADVIGRPKAFLAWAVAMFGPVAKLRSERLMRFIEEAIELAHADKMERSVLNIIADRVYSRPPGEITKEIGQAQACLETYAENIGESSDVLTQVEWERVQKIPRTEWEVRHAAKQALGMAESNDRALAHNRGGKS